MTGRILITGGLGYLGGRIVQKLAESTDLTLRVGDIKPAFENRIWSRDVEIVPMDVLSVDSLKSICEGIRLVIHLAAANEIESAKNPEQALLVNGLGTLRLLDAAEQAHVERFIYFSTAHVYGAPLIGTIAETTLPRPIHPYAITHRIAEDFVLAAHARRSMTGIVIRLSNGLGAPAFPRIDRWSLVANDLCRQAVLDKKLVLKSSGLQLRDFITITDICRAVVHFLDLDVSSFPDMLFNLGGEKPLRIIDLAQLISHRCHEVLGFTPPIISPDPSPSDISGVLNYRIDKLKATGFSLLSNFHDEIDATLLLCKQFVEGRYL